MINLRFLKHIFSKYKYALIFILLLSVLLSVIEIFAIRELSILINSITSSDDQYKSFLIIKYFRFNFTYDKNNIILCSIILLFFIKTFLFIFLNFKILTFTGSVDIFIRKTILQHVLKYKYSDWTKQNSSYHIGEITSFIPKIINQVFLPLIRSISDLFILFSIIVFLATLDLNLFLGCLVYFVAISFALALIFKGKNLRFGRLIRDLNVQMIYNIKSSFESHKEFTASNKIHYFYNKFINISDKYRKVFVKLNLIAKLPRILVELSFVLVFCFLFIIIEKNNQSLQLLSFYGLSGLRLIPIMSSFISLYNNYKSNFVVLEKIANSFFRSLKTDFSFSVNKSFTSLEINNLSYKYEHEYILKELNAKFNKFDRVLLKGPSGSGKSTLVNIILSYIKPTSGEIIFNGDNDSSFDNFYYLPQEGFIFNDSLRENITLGNENISNNTLKDAVENTDLFNTTNEKSLCFTSQLSDRGVNISGGQRQRISLCRALCSNAELIVLDEATNALDYKSEKFILKNVFEKYKNKTFVVISHSNLEEYLFSKVIHLKC